MYNVASCWLYLKEYIKSSLTLTSPYFCFVFVCRVILLFLCVRVSTYLFAGPVTGLGLVSLHVDKLNSIELYIQEQLIPLNHSYRYRFYLVSSVLIIFLYAFSFVVMLFGLLFFLVYSAVSVIGLMAVVPQH
jgi:hypothetical protein